MIYILIIGLVSLADAYIPESTGIRDKIFFGISEDPGKRIPQNVAGSSISMLPPASSQYGVNATASHNTDLNDYGSAGVPEAELVRRSEVAVAVEEAADTGEIPPRSFFEYQAESKATETVKHMLDVFSILWLILIIVACYFFLKAAITEASKRVTLPVFKRSVSKPTVSAAALAAQRKKENMRIDREAYVYVDGG